MKWSCLPWENVAFCQCYWSELYCPGSKVAIWVGALGLLNLQKDNGVILLLNGPFGKESVLYDFSLVALHTISIFSFHLWCMLRGIVWIWTKSNLSRSIRSKLIFSTFSMPKWVWFPMKSREWILFKRPYSLQAGTGNLPSMEIVVGKTTNSWPKVMLSSRITLI